MFKYLPPWVQQLKWSIFLHLVELCTYVLEGKGSCQELCSSCLEWVIFPVHHPGFMHWGQSRDGSMILICGHCAFLCHGENQSKKMTHLWSQFHCQPAVWLWTNALFCYTRILDKVEWGVIPLLLISGVWWKPNLKLDVKMLWEVKQWINANQNAYLSLSVFPICMLPLLLCNPFILHTTTIMSFLMCMIIVILLLRL